MRRSPLAVTAVVAAFVLVVAGTALLVDSTDEPDQAANRIPITLEGPKPTPGPEAPAATELTAPTSVALAASAGDVGDHDNARSENPVGVTRDELDAGREQQEKLAASDQLPVVTPDAAPYQAGCRTSLVGNYSSRRGVRPRLFVLHYTVSGNRPGWGDVDAIIGLFNTPSFAASSHYIIDNEGNCAYIVRESDKAWTQAAANPVAISVEIINSGREGSLAGTAGLRKLARVTAAAAKRWEIPLRAGRVDGCRVARAGVVDHGSLGACGGGHVDISPYSVAPVIAAAKALGPTASDGRATQARVRCRKLKWWRAAGRPHRRAERRAITRRQLLQRYGYRCPARGPVRAL